MTKLGLLDVGGTKYTLNLGETYFIGSKSNSYPHDIEIDDASVDIKHCILDFTERLPKLYDLRSKFGTFVDGMRVAVCQMIPLVKSTSIQFGNVEATLKLLSEGDSGYLEGRMTPPPKDKSDIICNSPEHITTSAIRLKHTLKNSLTSTPNATTITNNVIKDASEFLIPTGVARKSVGSSTSARSLDSFYIPETQCPVETNDRTNIAINVPVDTNQSKNRSTNIGGEVEADDDFFIPETQEVGRISNYPRVAFNRDDIHESAADDDKIPSSQFRICTQDFNGSDDNISNHSDDILANIPCSLIIPQIHHSPVRIDDLLNPDNDEEIEKEMSALQWSKRTGEGVEGSVTSDVINHVDGSITPDIIEHAGKAVVTAVVTMCNTPDLFANPDQSDCDQANKSLPKVDPQDFQPTQIFVKPASLCNSFIKPPVPLCDKENIGPQKDDLILPSTQVFMPPPAKIKPAASLPPPPPPPSTPIKVSSFLADDDLPPTQVFQKEGATPTRTSSFSSTLLDNDMQLSENSFRAKCNKFLDSDDDEMDEVIAPELVKKMRESVELLEASKTLPKPMSSNSTPKVDKSAQKEKILKKEKTPKEESKHTATNNCHVLPTTATKKSPRPQAAISIDSFIFTPDFLGKEFCKDKKLQEQAEVNWNNIISAKQRKTLFGSSSEDSQDSFNDLLPNKVENRNAPEKQEPEGRITRRRKSTFEEVSKNKKVPRKAATVTNLESDNKEIKESSTKREVVPNVDPHSLESKRKLKETHKEESAAPDNKEKKESRTRSVELHSHESKHKLKKSRNAEPATIASRPRRNTQREDNKNDDKDAKARPKSRTSENVSKSSSSKVTIKRTTRQTSKELENELKHHTENKSNLHDQLNSFRDKYINHDRNGLKQKALENEENEKKAYKKDATKAYETKCNEIQSKELENKSKHHTEHKSNSHVRSNPSRDHEGNGLKQKAPEKKETKANKEDGTKKYETKSKEIQSSKELENESKHHTEHKSNSHYRSNPSRDHEGNGLKEKAPEKNEKKADKKDAAKKYATKSKEVVKQQEEVEPLPRFTRLRSAKELPLKKADAGVSKEISDREKNNSETSRDKPKQEPTTSKDRSYHRKPKVDAICSGLQETSHNTKPTSIESTEDSKTSTTSKRKNQMPELPGKRQRSTSSTDSLLSTQSYETRRLRRVKRPKIAMTMCDPRYQAVLEKHSGALWLYTKDPKECDVMVVEKGNRTFKIMVAIARGIPVVKLDWLLEVLKRKSVDIPYEQYVFEDPEFQNRHQFEMKKSLHLARTTSLLEGMSFLMTPGIRPIPSELKDIIVCAGGTVLEHVPKQQEGDQIYLVSETKDQKHWHQYRRTNANIKIVSSEGVMASVMQQSKSPLRKSVII